MLAPKRPLYEIIALAGILLIATSFRFYRMYDLTEFLGDQGRTGMHIYTAWMTKSPPLVGPTVLTGEHLGPAFYYILAPSLLVSNFHPMAPAVFTALLGVGAVGLLWWISRELFGFTIGALLSLVWAVSSQIITSDRVLWEPNIIPFFVYALLVCLYKIITSPRFLWGLPTGVTLGILIQLHYPNLLFVVLVMWFLGYALIRARPEGKARFAIHAVFGCALGFVLATAPFFIYEVTHGFEDILGVLRNFFADGTSLSKRQILANFLDYGSRVIRRVMFVPVGWEPAALFLWLYAWWYKPKNFWQVSLGLWFFSGLGLLSLYKGVVHDHYLFFLLPAAFLLFGYALKKASAKVHSIGVIILVFLIALSHVSRSDIYSEGQQDIRRITDVSRAIVSLSERGNFSFALVSSRSFSDLHYQYIFLTAKARYVPIKEGLVDQVFLVCERAPCPTTENIRTKQTLRVVCFDDYCGDKDPKIVIDQSYVPVNTVEISGATLYQLKRRM